MTHSGHALYVGNSSGSAIEPEDALPVFLHADHDPAILLCLVVQILGEGADFRVGEPLGRAVCKLRLASS
jgi:hypothetical protein